MTLNCSSMEKERSFKIDSSSGPCVDYVELECWIFLSFIRIYKGFNILLKTAWCVCPLLPQPFLSGLSLRRSCAQEQRRLRWSCFSLPFKGPPILKGCWPSASRAALCLTWCWWGSLLKTLLMLRVLICINMISWLAPVCVITVNRHSSLRG